MNNANTQGDSDVGLISMLAGFRRHLVDNNDRLTAFDPGQPG